MMKLHPYIDNFYNLNPYKIVYESLILHLKYTRKSLEYDDIFLVQCYITLVTELVISLDKAESYVYYIKYIMSLPFSLSMISIDSRELLQNQIFYSNIITTLNVNPPKLPYHYYYNSPPYLFIYY